MPLALAKRYAQALADVVLEPASGVDPRGAVDQIQSVEELVAGSNELRTVLLNPAVTPSRKRAVVARLTEPVGLAPLVRNFLFVLIDRRRISILSEIREAFEAVLDERSGIVRAVVTSAQELRDWQRGEMTQKLTALTGSQVRSEFSVDESLLGGAMVRIGSKIYDGSLRGQLEILQRRLSE
jgi:F-type H+-transporting ATPase subunit delta